jgi:hypothetical protein
MPKFIHRVLDHALTHTWPLTVPVPRRHNPHSQPSKALTTTRSSLGVEENPVKKNWMHLALSHPVAFHAFIYATSLHLLNAYDGTEICEKAPLLRLSHKVETIKLVNELFGQVRLPGQGGEGSKVESRATLDALIMAVTIMSVHGQRDEVSCFDLGKSVGGALR